MGNGNVVQTWNNVQLGQKYGDYGTFPTSGVPTGKYIDQWYAVSDKGNTVITEQSTIEYPGDGLAANQNVDIFVFAGLQYIDYKVNLHYNGAVYNESGKQLPECLYKVHYAPEQYAYGRYTSYGVKTSNGKNWTDPVREGYSLTGFHINSESGSIIDIDNDEDWVTINGNHDLYATWQAKHSNF